MPATQVGPAQIAFTTTTISPSNFCPTTEQERLDKYATHLVGSLPGGFSTFVIGFSKPNPVDQDKAWFRLDSAGRPDRWYTFADGAWLAPHPVPVGYIQLYMGDITSIATFDGGSATGTPPYDGPFWEELKDASGNKMVGRIAVHPDPTRLLIQNQTNIIPANGIGTDNKVTFGSTGGEERHQLSIAELAAHNHQTLTLGPLGVASGSLGGWGQIAQARDTTSTGSDTAHNNMQPFFGAYYIRRTARTHYKINA